jgi:hypothetical protein
MLDAIRYMVVYNPIIFLVFSLLAHLAPHHTVHRWVHVLMLMVRDGRLRCLPLPLFSPPLSVSPPPLVSPEKEDRPLTPSPPHAPTHPPPRQTPGHRGRLWRPAALWRPAPAPGRRRDVASAGSGDRQRVLAALVDRQLFPCSSGRLWQ